MFNKKIFSTVFLSCFFAVGYAQALSASYTTDYSRLLYKYAKNGNISGFKRISSRYGVDVKNIDGDTALCYAISNNDPKTYKILLQEGSKSRSYCMQRIKSTKLARFEKSLYEYENTAIGMHHTNGSLLTRPKIAAKAFEIDTAKTGFVLGTVALIGGGVALAAGGGSGGGTNESTSGSGDDTGAELPPEFDPSIPCEERGGTLVNGSCVLFGNEGATPIELNPSIYYTKEYENSASVLSKINADSAYARGYTGYVVNRDADGKLINDGSSLITDDKVRVGILDNGFDIYHPDLIDNIVKDKEGNPYGYNFDYGPCRKGDKTNCFDFVIVEEDRGSIVFYDDDGSINDMHGSFKQEEYDELFSEYPDDYDWDVLKNNPIAFLYDEEGVDQITNSGANDHGTHVMGIIGASVNNVGINGVAPNVDMVGINFTQKLYLQNESVFEKSAEALLNEKVRVVNMSFGLDLTDEEKKTYNASYMKGNSVVNSDIDAGMISMFETFAENNIVTVKSAGNDGHLGYQADLMSGIPLSNEFKSGTESDLTNLFITVVSVNGNNELASYSNTCGAAQDYCLAAPGGDTGDLIYSTVQNDGEHEKNEGGAAYGYMQGTSMAAPVVTGSVALLMGAYPHLSSQQIVEILFRTATDLGENGIDEIYGNGLINLEAATSPIGYLNFDFLNKESQEQYTQSALSLSKSVSNKLIKVLPEKFMAFDEYNRGFAVKTSTLFADTSKQTRHLFENDFKAFMSNGVEKINAGNNVSFSVASSVAGNNIYSPYGFMQINYNTSEKSGFYAFYSESTILNNDIAGGKTNLNPFVSMDNAFGSGFNYKMGKSSFKFDYTSGRNNFFENEKDLDMYDNHMDAFSSEVGYDITKELSISSSLGMLREQGSMLGMVGKDAFDMNDTNTYFGSVKATYKPMANLLFSASYYRGYTNSSIKSSVLDMSDIVSDSVAFNATYNLAKNTNVGVDVYSPLRIVKGTADFYLANGRHSTDDKIYMKKYQASLKDDNREWNLSMFYNTVLKEDTLFKTRFGVRLNPEHDVNAKPDYYGMFNLNFAF